MLVITSHTVASAQAREFLDAARAALDALAARPGYRSGRIGRAVDDPSAWVLVTEWVGVGAYRRALSSYDVRVRAAPLLATAHDAPSAFEVLGEDSSGTALTDLAADAGTVGLGAASAPVVPTDLDETSGGVLPTDPDEIPTDLDEADRR